MLWDSGAGVSVISEKVWLEIGQPRLEKSPIILNGAFSEGHKCLGKMTVKLKWKEECHAVDFLVVKAIRPAVIGGVNVMHKFGIKLEKTTKKSVVTVEKDMKLQEQNKRLEDLVKRYDDVFMKHEYDLGFTDIVVHKIETEGKPIFLNPRRQSIHLESQIEGFLKGLEKAGIIRKCKSEWNSPLVITPKKDGGIRICLDFRKLNDVSKKVSFPMPDSQMLMDALGGSRIFSSIDLGKAYHQVALDESSQEKTAFCTRTQQYCFNRVPFGLSTAPGTFQRIMNSLFEDLLFSGVVIYLDDVLIYSKSMKDHMRLLEEVLNRLKKAGLKVNPGKCKFGVGELVFLGHTINKEGISTNKLKVAEIQNFPIPKCTRNLRAFLGLCNYYRRFIKNYAELAAPLHSACSGKCKEIFWSDECDRSFNELKQKLCGAPILAFVNPNNNFILDTDASFGSIGAVLSQISEEKEVVIAYASRTLTTHEKGYCVTRKELLALQEFMLHFKQYLYGKRFTARTDHKALVYMKSTSKPITPQFQTWLANMADFDFDLKYRKGDEHGNADGLSRLYDDVCAQCETKHEEPKSTKARVKHINTVVIQSTIQWIKDEQEKCSELNQLKQIQEMAEGEKNEITKELLQLKDQLVYQNGLWGRQEGNCVLPLVPKQIRRDFIRKIHRDLCHVGIKKTKKYIQNHFMLPDLAKEVQIVIGECQECIRRKIPSEKTKEKLIPIRSDEFLEQVVMDIAYVGDKNSMYPYLLVMVDQFSKLVSLTEIRTQNEDTIVQCVLIKWIYRYGKPKTILTDNGKCFTGGKFKDFCRKYGIEQRFSSPFQHQSNGLAERTIRTVRDMIVTSRGDTDKRSWWQIVPKIEFCLNATVQSTTGYSPFEVVFGRKINLHAAAGIAKTEESNVIKMKVRENLEKAARRMENWEREKRTNRHFEDGQKVFVKQDPTKLRKDTFPFDGPYQILRHISPHQLELQNLKDGNIIRRRIEWIKKVNNEL